ncbi:MAG: lipopolysaccharide biosynthesis protein RfbH [Candidatus Altiarchaeota archaeon]|nr:lipopolysaccharide biosynthesis protein RfbH [Candidatus Altiarchaeota archaeon]
MRTEKDVKKDINKLVEEYFRLFLDKKRKDIPVSGKKYDSQELKYIVDAALDGWWTEGRYTTEFEKKLAKYIGVKHAIVVNSGSSANLAAFTALTSPKLKEKRIRKGDEVITVAAGFPTTVNPIIQAGCTPVFCDVEVETLDVDVKQLKNALSKKTKAVFLAHTLGNPFNLDEVTRFCRKHDLWLLEDNCDALGSEYKGKHTGSFGDIATYSFYPAHHITMGEGGALTTDDDLLAKIIRSIRDWGRDCWCRTGVDNSCGKRYDWKHGKLPFGYDHKYVYSEVGYNLKNTDLNAAIAVAQMDKLSGFIKVREKNFKLLSKGLKKFEKTFILPKSEKDAKPSWFGYPLTLRKNCGFKREDILKALNSKKIGTRLLFAGNITKQPYFIENKVRYRVAGNLKNTDYIMENTFWIGVNPLVDKKGINTVVACLEETLDSLSPVFK